jgi:hypothetical protein
MQVLLKKSDDRHNIQCSVCGQGFRAYWERTSQEEQEAMRLTVLEELRQHHADDATPAAHPITPFNLPNWQGPAQYSGAALLGGLSGIRRVPPEFTKRP